MRSFLTFMVGNQYFAADIFSVIEIINIPEITQMPNSPDYMLGVINHRGKVLTVFDPKIKFGIESHLIKSNPCIVILEIEQESSPIQIGIKVDLAESVVEIDESEILPPPSVGAKLKNDIIEGIIKKDEKFIMILKVKELYNLELK